jgi:hypothetical protein
MTQKDNGGPAFPHDGRDNGPGNIKGRAHDGMSLRDWFAGQALAGFCSDPDMKTHHMANMAYELADAMLEARNK